jgi:TMEM175 potassium channel family protein
MCVLSITITLLVAEIEWPEYAPGQLLERLAAQWASYIAFLASFCYAGMIWLNHRAVFARVCYCDRGLHLANLFLLLTST